MRRYALASAVAGLTVATTFAVTPAGAAPVMETADHGRLEVNWGTLRLRYYGEAQVESEGEVGFKNAEKQAWRDGLNYGSEAARGLSLPLIQSMHIAADKQADEVKHAAQALVSSSSSYNTAYFSDGRVRVYLEGPLAKALSTSQLHFRQKEASEPAATEVTGIVFAADHSLKPSAVYQVVDEQQNVLFEAGDMAQAAYQKNLMGRWFRHPTGAELQASVGEHPLTIACTPDGQHLVVKKADWDKAIDGHRSLLVNGTIAIAMP